MFHAHPGLKNPEYYVPGLASEYVARRYGIAPGDIAKLGSAENPHGVSLKAKTAVADALDRLHLYPSWTAEPLRDKIADTYGYQPDQVVCGAGETEIISLLIRAFCEPGGKILMPAPCFPIYHLFAEAEGRIPVLAHESTHRPSMALDPEAYAAAIGPDIRVVFITNPHSPSGTWLDEADVRRLIEAAPEALVVLDEAYVHYSETPGYIHLAGEYEHLEWVFTKPGTYVLQVHLKGHVRQSKPEGWKTEINGPWKALTADKTVTSEVKRFVFQVGDLHINDQPHFGVSRTVKAGSAANTNVGDPIPLYGVDGDELHFTLEGSGHEDFKIVEVAGVLASITAQLAVAEKADLRYAERPYYDLRLRVSDRHDHENNKDTEQDDVIAVRIQVLPSSGPWVSLVFNDQHPQAKNEVVVDMVVAGMPAGATVSSLTLYDGVGDQKTQVARSTGNSETARFTVTQDQGGTRNFSGVVEYQLNNQSKTISSAVYPITWRH